MRYMQLSEGGVSRWSTPLACGPSSPELSKSYSDMANKQFTYLLSHAFTSSTRAGHSERKTQSSIGGAAPRIVCMQPPQQLPIALPITLQRLCRICCDMPGHYDVVVKYHNCHSLLCCNVM